MSHHSRTESKISACRHRSREKTSYRSGRPLRTTPSMSFIALTAELAESNSKNPYDKVFAVSLLLFTLISTMLPYGEKASWRSASLQCIDKSPRNNANFEHCCIILQIESKIVVTRVGRNSNFFLKQSLRAVEHTNKHFHKRTTQSSAANGELYALDGPEKRAVSNRVCADTTQMVTTSKTVSNNCLKSCPYRWLLNLCGLLKSRITDFSIVICKNTI
jgi:hypothetical protein